MEGKPRRSGAKLFRVRQPRIPIGPLLTIAAPIPEFRNAASRA
jgi:hypothetical protein